ncbi:barstar family protein [Paenibacillus sp. PR3]|uniref:Barstar family protein n=1 Tax=Paenibacillus terricola TaxID=2763503 RepID=A0ABR8MYC0_9BACL|nr:barstar family protein [Paenibacillus terricola]MBD3919514.1 barstar family protein [Paenibacillus terricola]
MMFYKYSLEDESNNIILGHFEYIEISNSHTYIAEEHTEDYFQLGYINFHFSDGFRQSCLGRKQSISNLYINILDNDGCTIGSYYFALSSPKVLSSSDLIDGRDFTLEGHLPTGLSMETLELWDLLRNPTHREYGIWLHLTKKQRDIWLEIIRIYHKFAESHNLACQSYCLDGRHITDEVSFYFALGEAINGPGGYYGGCIDSLLDCFCGGFGALPPFTIEISGYANKPKSIKTILQVLEEHKVTIIIKD